MIGGIFVAINLNGFISSKCCIANDHLHFTLKTKEGIHEENNCKQWKQQKN
jgi:hypothetical protein